MPGKCDDILHDSSYQTPHNRTRTCPERFSRSCLKEQVSPRQTPPNTCLSWRPLRPSYPECQTTGAVPTLVPSLCGHERLAHPRPHRGDTPQLPTACAGTSGEGGARGSHTVSARSGEGEDGGRAGGDGGQTGAKRKEGEEKRENVTGGSLWTRVVVTPSDAPTYPFQVLRLGHSPPAL